MLAAEAERRTPSLIAGIDDLASSGERDPDRVEALRVEAHGLKGAALVVGQPRLGDLARALESALKERSPEGRIDSSDAPRLTDAARAFRDGTEAAANGEAEPAGVGEALAALGG